MRSATRSDPLSATRLKGLIGLAFALWSLSGSTQELIANGGTDVEQLSRNAARLYLTMRIKNWPDGTAVKLFVLPDDDELHERFTNTVLGLYPYQLRRVWDRQIFSGTGQAPVTVLSPQEMIQRVASTPGALGYAETRATDPAIRVIEVR